MNFSSKVIRANNCCDLERLINEVLDKLPGTYKDIRILQDGMTMLALIIYQRRSKNG